MRPVIIVILVRARRTQGRFMPLDRGEDRVLGNRLLSGPQLLVLVTNRAARVRARAVVHGTAEEDLH
jgi:hypothetical protein